jgi:hemolysin-activating ACP:hemolysin acyltransferase
MFIILLIHKITAIRSKVNETFGQVALAMMAIPRYRHQSVGDLNHILLEPLIRDRVAIASAEKGQEARAGEAREGKQISDPTKAPLAGVAIWASVSDEVEAKIREQIKAGVFPIRLKGDEWNSGTNNWLLDIIAPNQQLTTAVIANFGQVVKQGDGKDGSGDIKIHPLITRLVDPEVLKKMGASPVYQDS